MSTESEREREREREREKGRDRGDFIYRWIILLRGLILRPADRGVSFVQESNGLTQGFN